MKAALLSLAGLSFCVGTLAASPLREARINRIINNVAVLDPAKGAHKAALQEVIKDEIGIVNLTGATLHADVVKVGALGNNGMLNVGGGTINADSTIKLYAGGSNGSVNFTDNVTLSGNSVKTITGSTVTIFNGKIVTVNGPAPASVFTDRANYTGSGGNGSTTGIFGGQGAVTQPLSAAPPGY